MRPSPSLEMVIKRLTLLKWLKGLRAGQTKQEAREPLVKGIRSPLRHSSTMQTMHMVIDQRLVETDLETAMKHTQTIILSVGGTDGETFFVGYHGTLVQFRQGTW